MAYVRDVRLHQSHEGLRAADPGRGATVTDIAMRWGFCNHSRFARLYRQAFGVTPRHTLGER